MTFSFRSAAAGFLLLGLASPLLAQGTALRREMATPGLVVETGARTGALDVLVFTPDGKYLLAAGDDKVVRTWKVAEGALEAIPPDAMEPQAVLRWPSMREHRGNIYALALAPEKDNQLVAVGGVGLKESQLALIDRYKGTIHNILPTLDTKRGGFFNIYSLAFSPSGANLVIGGSNGSVWRWDRRSESAVELGMHPKPAEKAKDPFNPVRLVHFLNEKEFVTGDNFGQVLLWQIGGAGPKILAQLGGARKDVFGKDQFFTARKYAAAGEKVAAALDTNIVAVLRLDRANHIQEIHLPLEQSPSALAFDPKTKMLAIAASAVDLKASFHKEVGQKTYLVDLDDARLKWLPKTTGSWVDLTKSSGFLAGPAATYRVEALAFHPEGTHLAVGGGDHHEVTLWKLEKTGWEKVGQVESPGQCIYGLRISEDGERLAFQDQRHADAPHPNLRGKGAWKVFDLDARKFLGDETVLKGFEANVEEQDGWKVITDRSVQWHVFNPHTREKIALPWDFGQFGVPLCYSFLPKLEEKKVHLVVGHYLGASVFELSKAGVRRVKYLIGHDGEVYCLAVARTKRGLLLLSAGRDQTITGWSLEPWKSHPLLGAQLLIQLGKLVVGEVDTLSPGWEMGLSKGDEIVGVWVSGNAARPDYLRGGKNFLTGADSTAFGTPESLIKAVDSHSAGNEMVCFWARPSAKGPLASKTTLKERPAWRFFPMRDKEWVLWRVTDYFYDCSTGGDRAIGWHVNSFSDKGYDFLSTPRFYPAERMRKLYHQPAKITQVLNSWKRRDVVYQTGTVSTEAGLKKGSDLVALERLDVIPTPGDTVRFSTHPTLYEVAKGSTLTELKLGKGLFMAVPEGTKVEFLGMLGIGALEPPQVEVTPLVKVPGKTIILKDGDKVPVLSVQVQPRNGRENQEISRVQVWINDYLFRRLEIGDKGLKLDKVGGLALKVVTGKDAAGETVTNLEGEISIPDSLLRKGKNRILVQAFNRADCRGEGKPVFVTMERPLAKVSLHGLFIGIGDYTMTEPRQENLEASEDARALVRVFNRYAGKGYKDKTFKTLLDHEADPKSILDSLDLLAKAGPDDLVMVHLGGHGLNIHAMESQIEADLGPGGKRSLTPRDLEAFRNQTKGMGEFLFVCANFNMSKIQQTTLRMDQIYEKLIKIPSQKIIFLDVCHSGAAELPLGDRRGLIYYPDAWRKPEARKSNDLIRLLTPDQVGPILFAACGPTESALEYPGLTQVERGLSGLFTQALVETIAKQSKKADVNKDSILDAKELGDHMSFLIDSFLEKLERENPKLRGKNIRQHPQLFLPELSRNFEIVRTSK